MGVKPKHSLALPVAGINEEYPTVAAVFQKQHMASIGNIRINVMQGSGTLE